MFLSLLFKKVLIQKSLLPELSWQRLRHVQRVDLSHFSTTIDADIPTTTFAKGRFPVQRQSWSTY